MCSKALAVEIAERMVTPPGRIGYTEQTVGVG